MKLAGPKWTNTLEWDRSHPGSLILEHPKDYAAVVSDLTMQEAGQPGELVLSEDGQELSFSRDVVLIRDLWAVDMNQRKLLNGIYKQASRIACEEYSEESCRLLEDISHLLGNLEKEIMLPLEWDDTTDILPLLKAYGVRLEQSSDPFERLLDYARLAHEILRIRLLVLVGVRSFLTAGEYCSLCRELAANELPVLFVDNCCNAAAAEGECRFIVDIDRCELVFS